MEILSKKTMSPLFEDADQASWSGAAWRIGMAVIAIILVAVVSARLFRVRKSRRGVAVVKPQADEIHQGIEVTFSSNTNFIHELIFIILFRAYHAQ